MVFVHISAIKVDFNHSLIADTRASASGALNASHAYQGIIDAIKKALNASKEAIKVAKKARDHVGFLNLIFYLLLKFTVC